MILGSMILAMMAATLLQTAPSGEWKGKRHLAPKGSPSNWVRDGDYPSSSLTRGAFGATKFQLDVDSAGLPQACHILNTSGFWELDRRVCWLMLNRAKFTPALDESGVPVAATFRSHFTWSHSDADRGDWLKLVKQVTEPLLIEVSVQKMPAAYKEPPLIRVRFKQDMPAECVVELTSGSAGIDRAACDQAMIVARLPDLKMAPDIRRPDTRMFLVPFRSQTAPPQ